MKTLSISIFLLLSLVGKAQNLSFSATADTDRILIGQQITLTLKGSVPEGTQFTWPTLPDTLKGLQVVAAGKLDTLPENGNWQLSQQLRLTSFDSGYTAIPALALSANDKSVSSPAIAVQVGMPKLKADQDLYDIKKPLEPPFDWLPILSWGGGILAGAGLLIWLVIWLLRRKKQPKLTPEQRLSPYEYAQKQLKELEKEQLWQAGKIKEYYSRLTDILRLYLERQMNVNAMESTADEVIEKVESLGFDTRINEKIAALMRTSAMAKYAKENPGPATNERSMATVQEFLEETRPMAQEEQTRNNHEA